MERLITILSLIALAFWSLLSLGVWALLSLGGDFLHGQLDWLFLGDPNLVPTASGVFRFFQNLGLGLIVIVWMSGAAAIWFCAFILRRFLQSIAAPRAYPVWDDFGPTEMSERSMKDVTPPRPSRALPRD